jgi:hypothetical protein
MKTLTLPTDSEVYTITGTEWLSIGISSMISPISYDEAIEKDKNIENGLYFLFLNRNFYFLYY